MTSGLADCSASALGPLTRPARFPRGTLYSHNFGLATWNSSGVHTLDATVPLACNALRGNTGSAVKVEPSSAGSSSAVLRPVPVTSRASRSMAYARPSDDEERQASAPAGTTQ
ncbi:uncharacterized protein BBA_01100 [Beauveria bassiana ARSEF 2860]|uniref:Uncharacterized protein n=1 Tax=Beauveria bassiana (strain ARSEF 2860) TaxID=655819 RepID=J5K812_BEAB2|nr:uncharacterized protein BBA_01100 [Beauveria bassiana ARSEF 2860]EJP70231.1 hypothetical protein BBA_01100 [Beauveria bassiana ARSEF 2860]